MHLCIYFLIDADLVAETLFQKLWRKDPFCAEASTFAEENLGRANFEKLIKGISKLNSFEIDFTASNIIKPATPTITTANRMVLRPMTKLREAPFKPQ